LRWWLLLQGSENEDGELQVCAVAKLVYATRNPGSIRALIAQGKFGDIGRGLLALIPQPQASPLPISDHQFRLIHGDGKWWALFSVAQSGIQKLVLLGFERSGQVGPETKVVMWSLLSIAERLCRELLAEEICSETFDDN
jgi:hypothetical protein